MVREKNIKIIDKSMRVRGEDLKNCIYPLGIKKVKPTTKTLISEPKPSQYSINFTIFGQHDKLCDIYGNEQENGFPITNDEEKKCAFIKYVGNNPPKYFVSMNSRGELYNPIGMYSEGTLNKDMKYAGKKEWQLKEVNSKIFNFYLNFLKTKNMAWLKNAERNNI